MSKPEKLTKDVKAGLESGEAHLSNDRRYRYQLGRVWDPELPTMMFVGLNPSTADANVLDPTLRRVVRFAIREGFGGFQMGNLFAFRATNPKQLLKAGDPVGPENDDWLLHMANVSEKIIVGWGTNGGLKSRDAEVQHLLLGNGYTLHCLGKSRDGFPKHPLYLHRDTPLELFA